LLRPYVHICATTGIRPGLAMDLLTFGNITVHRDRATKQDVTEVHIPRVKIKKSYTAVPFMNDNHFSFNDAIKELTEFHGGADPSQLLFELPENVVEDRVAARKRSGQPAARYRSSRGRLPNSSTKRA
jgi:hypothetical protein